MGGVKLSAKEYGNLTRFINHSPEPNASMFFVRPFHPSTLTLTLTLTPTLRGGDGVLHIAVVALGPIQKGRPILLDYGEKYWWAPLPLCPPGVGIQTQRTFYFIFIVSYFLFFI